MDAPLVQLLSCQRHSREAKCGWDKRWRHLSVKPTSRISVPFERSKTPGGLPGDRSSVKEWQHLELDDTNRSRTWSKRIELRPKGKLETGLTRCAKSGCAVFRVRAIEEEARIVRRVSKMEASVIKWRSWSQENEGLHKPFTDFRWLWRKGSTCSHTEHRS